MRTVFAHLTKHLAHDGSDSPSLLMMPETYEQPKDLTIRSGTPHDNWIVTIYLLSCVSRPRDFAASKAISKNMSEKYKIVRHNLKVLPSFSPHFVLICPLPQCEASLRDIIRGILDYHWHTILQSVSSYIRVLDPDH